MTHKQVKPRVSKLGPERELHLDIQNLNLEQISNLALELSKRNKFKVATPSDWELLIQWSDFLGGAQTKPKFSSIKVVTIGTVEPEDFGFLLELGLVLPEQ